MNREIKFRYYSAQQSEMVEWGDIMKLHVHTVFKMLQPECVLMQYTGLKDKKGVEIYEGDIVKSTPRDGRGVGIFKITYDSVYGAYIANFIEWCGLNISSTESYPLGEARFDIEIIGNIHENPELLNP